MKMIDVVQKLCEAAPYDESWTSNEPWGPYYVDFRKECNRILYCVTPTEDVVNEFHQGKYDLLVSHHPFIRKVPQVVLHTALDCTSGGMNDQWAIALGIKDPQHFDENLGWYGEIEPTDLSGLYKRVTGYIGSEPIGAVYSDIETISSVVVCSGLGGIVEPTALATGADCYILGEAIKPGRDSKFAAMIETGHTLSEHKPGLTFVRAILPDVEVVGASFDNDRFGNECRGM